MSLILKQSTSVDIRMGPAVGPTDGVTPVTSAAIAGADQAEVLKANGAATVAMTGTLAAVAGADGWYDYTCAAGDVDTVGEVVFVLQDSSLMLPIFVRAQVVEEAIYDALYGASATGFDANGRVDVGAVLGTAQTAGDVTALVTTVDTVVDGIQTDLSNATDGLGAIKADTAAALADTNELQTDWANGGRLDNILDARAAEATVTGLNNISAADVNAQVSDVLKTDTVSEPAQGAPSATPTMEDILNYLYRELVRNKVVVDTNTANQKQIFADDGTTILYEKDLTNASNVTTVAEATTGA